MAPLARTQPDLSNLFNLTLPPPPPLSSSGLLRPFVPIVPVSMLASIMREQPKPVAAKRRPWLAIVAASALTLSMAASSLVLYAASPGEPTPRAPRMAEVVGASMSFNVDLAEALASAQTPSAQAPAETPHAAPEPHGMMAAAHDAIAIREAFPMAQEDQSPLGKARAALKKGDLSNANFAYAEATGIPSLAVDGFVGLGDIAVRKGDYATAKRRYESALALAPRYFAARLGLADCAWDSGDRPSGRTQYRTLTHEYPKGMLPARAFDRAK